jgi:predicted Zn-ribbon and HTH transcriptional regulator
MEKVSRVGMKCNDCMHKYDALKREGGIFRKLLYSPSRCPECGSTNVKEYSGFYEKLGKLLGL